MRLHYRLEDLRLRVIPDFEGKTQLIYARIMPLPKDSGERRKLEAEYKLLSKELSIRSDELVGIRHQIENLEMEKKLGSR